MSFTNNEILVELIRHDPTFLISTVVAKVFPHIPAPGVIKLTKARSPQLGEIKPGDVVKLNLLGLLLMIISILSFWPAE
jgi:hypothetical protein